jgi:carboxylesterase type B
MVGGYSFCTFFKRRSAGQMFDRVIAASPGARLLKTARNQTDKSFLVLFFKKEHSSFRFFRQR